MAGVWRMRSWRWMIFVPCLFVTIYIIYSTQTSADNTLMLKSNRHPEYDVSHHGGVLAKYNMDPQYNVSAPFSMYHKEGQRITEHPYTAYPFNCRNIPDIHIIKVIKNGGAKRTFLGVYNGTQVIVKRPAKRGKSYNGCMRHWPENQTVSHFHWHPCQILANAILMREATFLQELNHPSLPTLHGFCLHDFASHPSDDSLNFVYVEELGRPLNFTILSIQQRFDYAHQIVDLMDYLSTSPIGPVWINDLRFTENLDQFVQRDGRIKLIDIEFQVGETKCSNSMRCPEKLPCLDGLCKGHIAGRNLRRISGMVEHILLHENEDLSNDAQLQIEHFVEWTRNAKVTFDSIKKNITDMRNKLIN